MRFRLFFIFFQMFGMLQSHEKISLVAGGAGFLGSHMCDLLINKGHLVICLDNLYTGSKENISHLAANPRFTFLKHDITQPLPPFEHLDQIYNFACPASPFHYQKDPLFTFMTNVMGTYNLLQLCIDHNALFFQASTSEVYGDPKEHPQKESYWGHVNPHGLRSCYDEGKRGAETLCHDFQTKYQGKIKIGRIFNTYGPRMQQQDGRVVSNFIVQALTQAPLTIYGSGNQTRSFCYVDDLIEAIFSLMTAQDLTYGPINIGNPEEYTVNEIASLILKLSRSSSEISYHPLPSDDPQKRNPDIELAKKLLKWEPKTSLNEGLVKTIDYFKKVLQTKS